MQLISKFNKEIHFSLCVFYVFIKYAWVISLKDKKVLQLLILLKKIYKNLSTNETKYGQVKAANFVIDQ